MTDPHDLDGQREAYRPEFRFFGENDDTLRWYAGRVVDLCRREGARSVLSLGIGQRIVCGHLIELLAAGELDRYAIVEGSATAIAELAAERPAPTGLAVHEDWFERFESSERFDVLEMGFVLEHVDDPGMILRRFRDFLAPAGVLSIAVPNARSLHRLIGHEAGLLADVYQLSAEDLALGHQRIFDLDRMRDLVAAAGYRIRREEGIFLKPVTTAQLAALGLTARVREALYQVARGLPAISNAIYLEAVTKTGLPAAG